MNIAVVNLTSGGMSGGYAKYLRELLPRLRAHRDVSRIDVFMPPGREQTVEPVAHTWPSDDAKRAFATLRESIDRIAPDVVFIPTTRFVETGRPTVVMVRNMEPLTEPFHGHTLTEAARNAARRWATKQACRKATRVIAVSQHVRDFITTQWHVPTERIGLVYHGVDAAPAQPARRPLRLPPMDGRWVLTAGSIRPARGLIDAILAWPDVEPDVTLAIAGEPDPPTVRHARLLRRRAEHLGVGKRILWLGRLSPEEMAWCYGHCDAFLTTTRAEACPNTGLEAMSHGCSIVSTSVDPMPEFFADVARFYPPGDTRGLVAAIGNALAEPAADRAARARRARARTDLYTWERTAERTVQELARAAGMELSMTQRETACGS